MKEKFNYRKKFFQSFRVHLSISHAIKVETKFLTFSMLSGQMTKFLLAEFGQVRQKISGSWP